ncbi:MAG: hypothetical protein QGH29_11485 [Kiritimatiellia bacterium]|jgi:hypothetical protein|nr:hypothetical protein [Kiritimatiellia bacterium]
MNLRADLIFPNEQRSASMVSMKSITRVASIVGPAVAILIIAFIVMNAIALAGKVKNADREWASIEPRKEQALKVLDDGKVNDGILTEIESWKHSSVDWAPQMISLQKAISPSIQLRSMRISQVLNQTGRGRTARTFSMTLSGTAVGREAETAVEGLQKHFIEDETFKETVASVKIPRYSADPANKANRIFDLECEYNPSPFE